MIRITSIDQALALRGTIPELAIIRSQQFQGEGYDHERDGYIIVMEREPDLAGVPELGTAGLCDVDGLTVCEYVEAFAEGEELLFEAVFQIDDERTIAIIITDGPWLDQRLRRELHDAVDGRPLAAP